MIGPRGLVNVWVLSDGSKLGGHPALHRALSTLFAKQGIQRTSTTVWFQREIETIGLTLRMKKGREQCISIGPEGQGKGNHPRLFVQLQRIIADYERRVRQETTGFAGTVSDYWQRRSLQPAEIDRAVGFGGVVQGGAMETNRRRH